MSDNCATHTLAPVVYCRNKIVFWYLLSDVDFYHLEWSFKYLSSDFLNLFKTESPIATVICLRHLKSICQSIKISLGLLRSPLRVVRLNSTIRKKYQEKYQLRKMGGDWSTGLFGCFADPGSFCLAVCGWPFLVGKIHEVC